MNSSSYVYEDKDYILWVLLLQARDGMLRAREKELSQYGVSTMDVSVLNAIYLIGDNTTPAEISRWIFREHNTVGSLLSRMEKKGLITKTRDSDRRNMWRVSLTEKGQNAYHQSVKRESVHAIMSILSKNERQRLELYIRKLRDESLKHLVSERTLAFPY